MKFYCKTATVLLALFLSMIAMDTFAKTKVIPVIKSNHMRDNRNTDRYTPVLDCNGFDVKIEADGNGNTLVYVDEDYNGIFDASELAEIDEEYSWEDVQICIGGGGANGRTTLTMTGGTIGSIYAGECMTRVDADFKLIPPEGNVSIIITGGEVVDFIGMNGWRSESLPSYTSQRSLYLSNMTYSGSTPIQLDYNINEEDNWTKHAHEVIIANCNFVYEDALPDEDALENVTGGYFVQSYDGKSYTLNSHDPSTTFTIPGYIDVVTEYIDVRYELGSYLNNGNIEVTKCGGFPNLYYWSGNSVKKNDHNFIEEIIKAPTCENGGVCEYRCTNCYQYKMLGADILRGSLPPLGHKEMTIAGIPATCVADGKKDMFICEHCGTYLSGGELIPAIGHIPSDPIEVSHSTCTSDDHISVCLNGCGATWYSTSSVASHNWGDPIYENHSCSSQGMIVRKCMNDGCEAVHKEPCDYFATHSFKKVEALEPTCTENGHGDYIECTECGYIEYGNCNAPVIPMLGHNYIIDRPLPGNENLCHEATCTEPAKYYTLCSRCYDYDTSNEFEYGSPNRHKFKIQSIQRIDPAAPELGKAVIKCQICGFARRNYAFGYRNTKLKTIKKRPTCSIGEGEYTVTVDIDGETSSLDYVAYIPPMYAVNDKGDVLYDLSGNPLFEVHDYDSNGVCQDPNHVHEAVKAFERHTVFATDDFGDYQYETGSSFDDMSIAKTKIKEICSGPTDIARPAYTFGLFEDTKFGNLNVTGPTSVTFDLYTHTMDGTEEGSSSNGTITASNSALEIKNGRIKNYDFTCTTGDELVLDNVNCENCNFNWNAPVTVITGTQTIKVDYSTDDENHIIPEFTLEDGEDYTFPLSFTADKLTYTRSVTGGRVITFVLPAAVPVEKINGKVYMFSKLENSKFVFNEVTGQTMPNVPYLVVLNDESTELLDGSLTSVNVSLSRVPDTIEDEVTKAQHIGSYVKKSVESDPSVTYYGYSSASSLFVKALTGTINPYRTMFSLPTQTSEAHTRITLQLEDEDETNIIAVDAKALMGEGSEIFDLNGRKIKSPQNGRVYIVNGIKTVKK